MYPLKMKPAYKDYLWGGTRLRDSYGKQTDTDPLAESWEISCHPDGPSVVDGGPLDGKTLQEVLAENPQWMGTDCKDMQEFPLLIKFIDAKKALSIQVHPEDKYARRVENQQGKNEMWYVVDALPDSQLYLGTTKELSKNELREAIENDSLMELLCSVPVKAGDCYCIPAGFLHAIGEGCLIAEIQQNSNVTYRVYDFGRRDASGNLRELHIDKALDVTNTSLKAENRGAIPTVQQSGFATKALADWSYFGTELLDIQSKAALHCCDKSFHCLLAVEGDDLTVSYSGEKHPLNKGESVFIPAGLGAYSIRGTGKVLLTNI